MRIIVNEVVEQIAKSIEEMDKQSTAESTIMKAAEIARQYSRQRV